MQTLNADTDIDLIVITRGGGHQADLNIYNQWPLAQAIVQSRVPVLTAIGHRQDRTLADLIADHSVATPSLVGPALSIRKTLRVSQWIQIIIPVLILIVTIILLLSKTLGWW